MIKDKNSYSYTVECATNISELFSVLMNDYANILEKINCESCSCYLTRNVTTVNIPNVQIIYNNFFNLEFEMNRYFLRKYPTYCDNCKVVSGTRDLSLGPFLWITTEDAYYSFKYNRTEARMKEIDFYSKIEEIPTEIKIVGKAFVLCGVAEYKHVSTIGHYIAYCKCTKNYWYQLDDLKKKSS